MPILFSLLGWLFTFVAVFIAIGDPMLSPGYEAAQEHKQYATIAAMLLALLFAALGVVRGLRGFREARLSSAVAILLSMLWSVFIVASFVFREQ
jgi:hypothetical protein